MKALVIMNMVIPEDVNLYANISKNIEALLDFGKDIWSDYYFDYNREKLFSIEEAKRRLEEDDGFSIFDEEVLWSIQLKEIEADITV